MFTKYSDFTNIFLFDFKIKFTKYASINKYSINLINNKQLLYRPI